MLTGSVVMELYGLRAANDVDYISRETTELKLEGVGDTKLYGSIITMRQPMNFSIILLTISISMVINACR